MQEKFLIKIKHFDQVYNGPTEIYFQRLIGIYNLQY